MYKDFNDGLLFIIINAPGLNKQNMFISKKDLIEYFPGCFLANIILFFGLLSTHRFYYDDIGRSMSGTGNWIEDGRPFADYFITMVNLGRPLVNTFPLPQIISICIIVSAGILLARTYSIKSRLMVALCTLPLAGQPYFLQNMAYTFDSPAMALALFFSVCAALIAFNDGRYNIVFSAFLLFLALGLYQASTSVFFVIFLFLIIYNMQKERKIYKYISIYICKLSFISLISFLLYFFLTKYLNLKTYATRHSNIVSIEDIFNKVPENISIFLNILSSDWLTNFMGSIFILLFCVTLIISFCSVYHRPEDFFFDKKSIIYSFFSIIILVLAIIAAYFPQIILEKPVWAPRTFVGFGAFLTCCCLANYSFVQRFIDSGRAKYSQIIVVLLIYILTFNLISFSYAFSKANYEQKSYENMICNRLIADIDPLLSNDGVKYMSIAGDIGKNPLLKTTIVKYPLIDRLTAVNLKYNLWLGYTQLNYIGVNLKFKRISNPDLKKITHNRLPIISRTKYDVYRDNDSLIFKFK